jgi:rubredoxin
MSESIEGVNPANSLCPMCGAADWVSDTRWQHALHTVYAGTMRGIEAKPGQPMMIPVDWFVCRVCRFLRLHAAGGTLEFPDN